MDGKPLSVERQEFIASMTTLINNAILPAFVVEDVMKELLQQVHVAAIKQYEDEKAQYEQQVKKQNAEQ